MFRGTAVQKLEEKYFFIKVSIIIEKYAYVSRKCIIMTRYFFDILKELINKLLSKW